jgi:flagellum-specific ATP synthase
MPEPSSLQESLTLEPALSEGMLRTLVQVNPYQELGIVERVVGLVIETLGPKAKLGDICLIETGISALPYLKTEVIGFKEGRLQLMPLGEMLPLAPGCRVRCTGQPLRVPVGNALVGRVLDALGNPLDDRFELGRLPTYRVQSRAPHPLKRKDVETLLPLGVRAVDGMLTLGKGQRVGIFAGSGVGKSTLLGMMARNSQADLNVIALIGERGREVREFMQQALGPEGLARSVLVVATAEQSPLLKIKAGLVATSIAESFREQGKDVLLMMDSLTRIAMALREVGLSIGEPPATRGYTPSVFAFMPQLLERAGNSEKGSITGLYTVLVEGDDMNEPIADLTRGLLDGHIVLSRSLAQRNHFPAVDVLASISRVMPQLVTPDHFQKASQLRNWMATYQQSEDLMAIGAYVAGSNPKLDEAVRLKDTIDGFLKQPMTDSVPWEVMQEHLFSIQ